MELTVQTLRAQGWATLVLRPALLECFAELIADANWFFDKPVNEKAELDIRSSIGHRGWVTPDEAGDYNDEGPRCYEAFDIGQMGSRPASVPLHPLSGENRWPTGIQGALLQRRGEMMFSTLATLASSLGAAVCADLDVEPDEFHQLRREPVSQLRLIRYFDAPVKHSTNNTSAAMGAHTDYEFFTFLFQSAPGTEVLGRDGNWTSPPHEGVLTVLAGDMLEVFSNGVYVSTLHRVTSSVEPGRVSIPYFAGADFNATVKPVVDGPRSEGIHFGNHLMSQLRRDFPYLRVDRDLPARPNLPARSVFEERALRRQNRPD